MQKSKKLAEAQQINFRYTDKPSTISVDQTTDADDLNAIIAVLAQAAARHHASDRAQIFRQKPLIRRASRLILQHPVFNT